MGKNEPPYWEPGHWDANRMIADVAHGIRKSYESMGSAYGKATLIVVSRLQQENKKLREELEEMRCRMNEQEERAYWLKRHPIEQPEGV